MLKPQKPKRTLCIIVNALPFLPTSDKVYENWMKTIPHGSHNTDDDGGGDDE